MLYNWSSTVNTQKNNPLFRRLLKLFWEKRRTAYPELGTVGSSHCKCRWVKRSISRNECCATPLISEMVIVPSPTSFPFGHHPRLCMVCPHCPQWGHTLHCNGDEYNKDVSWHNKGVSWLNKDTGGKAYCISKCNSERTRYFWNDFLSISLQKGCIFMQKGVFLPAK